MKANFLQKIGLFEKAEIYITDRTNELEIEIYENMIPIGMPEGLANEMETEDILIFLAKLKANRKEQLLKSKIKTNLIYYIWYDAGAGQLRLNFINSNHPKLPFGATLNLKVSERHIVESFIEDVRNMYNFEEHDETILEDSTEKIDWKKLEEEENEWNANYILPVYSEIIKHND
jgi:hypothetical protein